MKKNGTSERRARRGARGIAELERRAENGDGEAAWVLGDAYADGERVFLPDGTRVKVRWDREKALRWFRRVVELGRTDALCRLGVLLTDTGRPEDVAEGIALLKRGWRKGCPVAAQNLAVTYSELGNPRRCAAWLWNACKREESADWFLLGHRPCRQVRGAEGFEGGRAGFSGRCATTGRGSPSNGKKPPASSP